jgi:hypothetical protein
MKTSLLCLLILFAAIEKPILAIESRENEIREEDRGSFSDRLVYGGGIFLNFGTVTYIYVGPSIGYRITDQFTAGLNTNYTYFSQRNVFSESFYGGGPYANYRIFENFLLHTEYEALYMRDRRFGAALDSRIWLHNVYLGVGYRASLGRRSFMQFSILYNVNYDPIQSPYNNPLIRIGFGF